jgi:hypothetical protein
MKISRPRNPTKGMRQRANETLGDQIKIKLNGWSNWRLNQWLKTGLISSLHQNSKRVLKSVRCLCRKKSRNCISPIQRISTYKWIRNESYRNFTKEKKKKEVLVSNFKKLQPNMKTTLGKIDFTTASEQLLDAVRRPGRRFDETEQLQLPDCFREPCPSTWNQNRECAF